MNRALRLSFAAAAICALAAQAQVRAEAPDRDPAAAEARAQDFAAAEARAQDPAAVERRARAEEGAPEAGRDTAPEAGRAPAAQARIQYVQNAKEALVTARSLYAQGQYFKAARYAFLAADDKRLEPEAYSWITAGLSRAGLYQSAAYFYIRTLQSGDKASIRRALGETETLLMHVGGDLFRRYLIRYTEPKDYEGANRSAYLYSMGKEALLRGDEQGAIAHLSGVAKSSPLWAYALQLRGTAYAIRGEVKSALRDFQECVDGAQGLVTSYASATGMSSAWVRREREQAEDLMARCQAGLGRTHYQANQFVEADRAYDSIPKNSFVWTDILFEQAWNAFARGEYNRSLGKLVTYKSPALSFVFNSEVDVLRAQSYLGLCLYADANEVINEFNRRYEKVGRQIQSFVESGGADLGRFHDRGRKALLAPLHAKDDFDRVLNRFVRSPYFQRLVATEDLLATEAAAVRRFDAMQPGVSHREGKGFPGFLDVVLQWRRKTVRALGGAFVKNSLLDHHRVLLADFDKIAFIKLEMLSRAKEKLLYSKARGENRARGNVEPERKSYQYYWSFNGEFWNDEIGDYVFGLESECEG